MLVKLINSSAVNNFLSWTLSKGWGSPSNYIKSIYIYKGTIPSNPDHLLYTSELYNSGSSNDLLLTFENPIFISHVYSDTQFQFFLYPSITSVAIQSGTATWGALVVEKDTISPCYFEGSPMRLVGKEGSSGSMPSLNKKGISILGLVDTSGVDYMFHLNTTNIIIGNTYTLITSSIKYHAEIQL